MTETKDGRRPEHQDAATGWDSARHALDHLLEGCQVISPDWRYLYVNDAVTQHGRRSKEELLGRTMMEVYPDIETTPMFAALRRCMAERTPARMENEFKYADGATGWFELSFEPVPEGVLILSMDVTGRKRAEAEIQHLNAVLRGVRNVNQLIVRERDPDRVVQRSCELLVESRGFACCAVILTQDGRPVRAVTAGDAAKLGAFQEMMKAGTLPACAAAALGGDEPLVRSSPARTCQSCTMAKDSAETCEVFAVRIENEGSVFGVLLVSIPPEAGAGPEEPGLLLEAAGDIGFALRSIRVEAERDAATERERGLAFRDAVTDLPNRAGLAVEVATLGTADGGVHGRFSLLVVDLHRFRDVNFALGYRKGNALLSEIGPRIREALGPETVVARLEGDRFGVLLPAVVDGAGAMGAADSVRAAFRRSFDIDGVAVDVDVRTGIAVHPEHGNDFDTLLRNAFVACHRAREAGIDQAVYAAEQDGFTGRRLALMADLRRAITDGQLVLAYQPVVDLRAGSAVAVEALVRWRHPELGMIPPDEFIGLAEYTGAIRELTGWVLDRAAADRRIWLGEGWPLGVAVNVSARNLADPAFPDQARRVLGAGDAAGEGIELEITESTIMADPDRARAVLTALVELGVRVSVDDFGTGYSSLAHLRRFPVHALKIDRSFLGVGPAPAAARQRDGVIIRTIVEMGHALALTVVAEGVEDQETVDFLRDLGCDRAQGYHIGKPMPVEQVLRWLVDSPWGRRTSRGPERA